MKDDETMSHPGKASFDDPPAGQEHELPLGRGRFDPLQLDPVLLSPSPQSLQKDPSLALLPLGKGTTFSTDSVLVTASSDTVAPELLL